MTSEPQLTLGQRFAAVLDHLGIRKAHVAAGAGSSPSDLFALVRERPESIASITLLTQPGVLDESAAEPFARHIACLVGESPLARMQQNLATLQSWDGVTFVDYPAGYPIQLWADIVLDNTQLIVTTLAKQEERWPADAVQFDAQEGEAAEVTYRVAGNGPALVLFPIGLAPAQWEPAIELLNQRFTTVRLGGEHIGTAQNLELRARTGTFLQGIRSMLDLLDIEPGDRALEVGTGQGTFARDLASRVPSIDVVAVDINGYMLGEARNYARKASLLSPLQYDYGNAEDLPFEDGSFDVAFAVTVFEECNADKAIAELHRVLKPGGRGGVIVRSKDLPWFWNLELPDDLLRKLNEPDGSAGVGPGGCVDASIYARFAEKFAELKPNAFWNNMSEGPPLPNHIARVRTMLETDETRQFEEALTKAQAESTFFAAMPLHCVVGTKSS